MLEEMIPRVETSFVLDRLDYMKKGGRCSTATALGASLLKLHPCLDVVDGKLPVTKKYRGSIEKVVEEYVRDRLRDRADLDTHRAFLVDTCPDDHLASIAREVLRQDGRFQESITTDSTCDLPRELLERYNITVTPLGIIKAGKLYQDGVDIRTGDIAAHVDAGGEITTTNAVNVADYEELFRRLMEEYDAVIHLNIGMGFSSCHQNARLAAEEVDGVYVVDSANLTVGHGMLVLAAAEAAEAGKSVTEIN